MKKRVIFSICALAIAAIMGGCCSACKQRTKNAKPLTCTSWHLVQLGGKDLSFPDEEFNIVLHDGNMSGMGACNRMMGSYSLGDKKRLDFGPVAMTRAYCPECDTETQMAVMLENVTHYDIDYDMLLLITDGTIKAVFKALPATPETLEK